MTTTKTLTRTALLLLAGTLAPTAAHAAIDISESSTYYDVENWYAIRNGGTPKFTSNEDSLQISVLSNDAYIFSYMKPIFLDVGEFLEASFTFSFVSANPLDTFSFGLFNCGGLSEDALNNLLAENAIASHGVNYAGKSETLGIKPLTGEMNGIFVTNTSVYSRFAGNTSSGFMTTNAAASVRTEYPLSVSQQTPSVDTNYSVSMKILRIDSEDIAYDVTLSMGDSEEETVRVENSQDTFNLIGIRSPVSGTGNAITLTNLSVTTTGTVIPEPSAFGLLAGAFALALAGTRRRRRRAS